jgi:hypothetical protein
MIHQRTGIKQAALIDMRSRPEGATIEEMATALKWEPNAVRGAASETLRKKLGLIIPSRMDQRRRRVYRSAAQNLA